MKKLLLVITFLTATAGLFAQAPVITSFSPLKGQIGATVTISGSNFDTVAAKNIVKFGFAKAVVTAATSTQLTVTVPVGAGYKPISVLTTANHLAAYSGLQFTPLFTASGSFTAKQFGTPIRLQSYGNSVVLMLEDLNGDNKPELIQTGQEVIEIHANTSRGAVSASSFPEKIRITTNGKTHDAVTADIDNDGRLDILTANYGHNSISVYLNRITGNEITATSFVKVVVPYGTKNEKPYKITTGDLDGDGKTDMVVLNENNTLSIFKNTSVYGSTTSPLFAQRINLTIDEELALARPAIGDLNGDGKPEIVLLRIQSAFLVLTNQTTPGVIDFSSFDAYKKFATQDESIYVTIGDIDGDTKPDVITSGLFNKAYVSRNKSTSAGVLSFAKHVGFDSGISMTLSDYNGDGKVDIAGTNNESQIMIARSKAQPGAIDATSFNAPIAIEPGQQPASVCAGDINGDGKPDLALLETSRFEIVLIANDYKPVAPVITSFSPLKGAKDTVVTITGSNFSNNLTDNIVHFGAVKGVVTSASPNQLTVKVPAGATYGPITVLISNTDLTARSTQSFNPIFTSKYNITKNDIAGKIDIATGILPTGIASGDLDGDGKPDFVTINSQTGTLQVFHNKYVAGKLIPVPFPKFPVKVGSNPVFVTINDINNDGKPDILIANAASNTISILRNTSAPGTLTASSFPERYDLPTTQTPSSVNVSDIDGDGVNDLVVANSGTNSISVIRNIGNSQNINNFSFDARINLITGGNPSSVTTADINGDGKPDIIAANAGSNSISVLLNTAVKGVLNTSSFAKAVNFTVGTNPSSVICTDINGDGKPDVIVSNKGSNNVSVLINTIASPSQSVSFAAKVDHAVASQPVFIAPGDIDGDGIVDITAVNMGSNSVSVLRNLGNTFAPKVDLVTGNSPTGLTVNDMDDDGKPDLLVTNKLSNSVSALRNNPDKTLPVITSFSPESGNINSTVVITGKNFDKDAVGNIVLFGATRALITSATTTQLTVTVPAGATYKPISVTRLSSNLTAYSGKPFTVTVPNSTNVINLEAKVNLEAQQLTYAIASGDVDSDGKPDLAYASIESDLITLINNKAAVGEITAEALGKKYTFNGNRHQFTDLEIADINGDGQLDMIGFNSGNGELRIYRNTGRKDTIDNNSFAPAFILMTGFRSFLGGDKLHIKDIDNDGKPDIILVGEVEGPIGIYKNTTVTHNPLTPVSFAPKVEFNAGLAISTLAIFDIDADNRLDIIASNYDDNKITLLRNIGTAGQITSATFAPKIHVSLPYSPFYLNIADFDNDGRPDVVVANRRNSSISIFKNFTTGGPNSTVAFSAPVNLKANKELYELHVADMNGDSKPDIVVTNVPTGKRYLSVYLNQTTNGTINNSSFAAKADFELSGQPNATNITDIDGDGLPDVTLVSGDFQLTVFQNKRSTSQPAITSTKATGNIAPISVYPNPAAYYANLEYDLPGQSDVTIKLFNQTGKIAGTYTFKKQAKGANKLTLPTGDLQKGLYIITLSANGYNITGKLIKE